MTSSFHVELRDGLAIITFDEPGSKVNTLGTGTLNELSHELDRLRNASGICGMILRSGKQGQCIAGANLKEIARLAEGAPGPLLEFIELGHRVFAQLDALPFPTVGIVDGTALGGGLELLLSCDVLIGVDGPRTRLGLPEVSLGLIPAWGGTQRLPRRVGILEALKLLTSGKHIDAGEAVRLGLCQRLANPESSVDEAEKAIDELVHDDGWRAERLRRRQAVIADECIPSRLSEALFAESKRTARQNNPAVAILVDVVWRGASRPLDEAVEIERTAAIELFLSIGARNRIFVFFMKTWKARENEAQAKSSPVATIGVVGAGVMGSGIAAVAAARGFGVCLVDTDGERLKQAIARVEKAILKAGSGSDLKPLRVGTQFDLLEGCDCVIEAVPEVCSIKVDVLARIGEVVGAETLVATNTSSLTVGKLASAVIHSERFFGMHFFNPAEHMELIELSVSPSTSEHTLGAAIALSKRLGKVAIAVNDCAGFVVNRLLFAYMREALHMAEEGVAIDQIDAHALAFGMPIGPFGLLDLIGIDTAISILKVLEAEYGQRFCASPLLASMMQAGRLGRKYGGGFYDPGCHPLVNVPGIERTSIQERLLLPILLEATRLLEHSVVFDPRDIDLALVLGAGFPHAWGGILRWADVVGAAVLVNIAIRDMRSFGDRFTPTPLLLKKAESGASFHQWPQT